MKVTVNEVNGFADAFVAMYQSKRTWTPELDKEIREVCNRILHGAPTEWDKERFNNWLNIALKKTKRHITIGKFIQISIMTEGIHRGGQDDLDSHAVRFNNRIIRSSTRLATFSQDEFSDFYKGKVLTTDTMLAQLGVNIPDVVIETTDGSFYSESYFNDLVNDTTITDVSKQVKNTWVKSTNGYVKEEYKDDKDVKRGLYMLGIPSNFVSQISLTEFAHVYKERGEHGSANPEVKEWAESVIDQLEAMYPQINRKLMMDIQN